MFDNTSFFFFNYSVCYMYLSNQNVLKMLLIRFACDDTEACGLK